MITMMARTIKLVGPQSHRLLRLLAACLLVILRLCTVRKEWNARVKTIWVYKIRVKWEKTLRLH